MKTENDSVVICAGNWEWEIRKTKRFLLLKQTRKNSSVTECDSILNLSEIVDISYRCNENFEQDTVELISQIEVKRYSGTFIQINYRSGDLKYLEKLQFVFCSKTQDISTEGLYVNDKSYIIYSSDSKFRSDAYLCLVELVESL
jgi:hypothetical protein